MKLMTKKLEKAFEKYPLYSQDGKQEKVVVVKFFNPIGNGKWYATEGSKQEDGDWLFFGYAEITEGEWGYFSLSELESVRLPYGIVIERDRGFKGSIRMDGTLVK